jgi:hypothetical protein
MKNKGIEINFRPSIKQDEAWGYLNDTETTFVGYGGSGNSGKSYLECHWLTMNSITYPGTGWFLGRETLTVLKDTTLKTLYKVFNESNIRAGRDYKFNGQSNVVQFSNGSEIFLLDLKFAPSDHLYQWLGGYEFTGGCVDESGEVNRQAIVTLASRIGRRRNHEYKLKAKICEGFNPSKTHVYSRYYKPWKEKKLPTEYKFVKALPSDNPSPEVDEWIKTIQATKDKQLIERLIEGNFEYDDDPAALIDIDKANDVFSNLHVARGRKYVTADIARLGGDRIVIIEWDGMRGKVTAFEKKLINDSTANIEAARIRNCCGKSDVIVDSDGMGSGVQDFGGFKGFMNGSSPLPDPRNSTDADGKPVKESFDSLKSQCGFRVAEIINNNGLYLECEDWMKDLIIEEFEQVKQKKLDSDMKKGLIPKDKVKANIGRSPDFWDAILMRIWFELKPRFVLTADSV